MKIFRQVLRNYFLKLLRIIRDNGNLTNVNATPPPSSSSSLLPPKEFKTYPDLVDLLISRGMIVEDKDRAIRKLSQIGYYRLSGYWHPCRDIEKDDNGCQFLDPTTNVPKRSNSFLSGTNIDNIIKLYLFDKKLRLLLLDAIERIEVHLRSVIAHELGSLDPLAYKNEKFIHNKSLVDYQRDGTTQNNWRNWTEANKKVIERSRDTFIKWNKKQYKEIPFWVVVETWDFGIMSNYYNILGDKHKEIICRRVNVPTKKTLNNWLQEINTIRNKCAHHSRIWNYRLNSELSIKGVHNFDYFRKISFRTTNERRRMFGCISVLWYLVKNIGPSSTWLENVANHIDTLPVCEGITFSAMGFPDETGFPREKFDTFEA